MEDMLRLLQEVLPKVDFNNDKSLVDNGTLDSLDIISIISELSSEYDIEIPAEEITPENFNSAEAIYTLVEKLLEED